MEDEAHGKAFYMAWILYPCFFIVTIGQILSFYLYNRKYHPFSEILKGVRKQGIFFSKIDAKCLFECKPFIGMKVDFSRHSVYGEI